MVAKVELFAIGTGVVVDRSGECGSNRNNKTVVAVSTPVMMSWQQRGWWQH